MPYNNQDFDKDWDKAPQARKTLASLWIQMRDNLTQAESIGNNASGSGELGLESDIHALSIEIENPIWEVKKYFKRESKNIVLCHLLNPCKN
jgi:hypothetical protein